MDLRRNRRWFVPLIELLLIVGMLTTSALAQSDGPSTDEPDAAVPAVREAHVTGGEGLIHDGLEICLIDDMAVKGSGVQIPSAPQNSNSVPSGGLDGSY